MRIVQTTLLGLLAACDHTGGTSAPNTAPVRFLASNALLAPVIIAVDGTPYASLTSGRSSPLTVAASARWLTWTSAKPTDASGTQIPDDIGEVRLSLTAIPAVLEISNVIEDQTYITARIFNSTGTRVAIGVYNAPSLSCAGILPPAVAGVHGFVQIGYYRLLPQTEIRAYRDGATCTGPYSVWSRSLLSGFVPKSGVVALTLDSAP